MYPQKNQRESIFLSCSVGLLKKSNGGIKMENSEKVIETLEDMKSRHEKERSIMMKELNDKNKIKF